MKNKTNHNPLIIILLALIYTAIGCSKHITKLPEQPTEIISPYLDFTKATIIYYSLDGCSWMLLLEDGKKLEPVNLADEFKKEDLKVWVKYNPYENFSFCMAGEMVTITEMSIRETE